MRIATIAGIPIRLHWSFLGLAGLYFAFTLVTTGVFEAAQLLFVAIALFGSVILHELGHALTARAFDIGTAHITLYPFGGIAAIERMPTSPRQELLIALAGPAVNIVLFTLVTGLWMVVGGWGLAVVAGLNLLMGVFNLLPAFPMDGGRILRALLADRMGWVGASRFAMGVGQVFAFGFLGIGAATLTPSLLLVGGFLLFAVIMERRRLTWMLSLGWRPDHEARPAPEADIGPVPAQPTLGT